MRWILILFVLAAAGCASSEMPTEDLPVEGSGEIRVLDTKVARDQGVMVEAILFGAGESRLVMLDTIPPINPDAPQLLTMRRWIRHDLVPPGHLITFVMGHLEISITLMVRGGITIVLDLDVVNTDRVIVRGEEPCSRSSSG